MRASYDDELDAMVRQLVMTGHKRIGFAYLSDARAVNVPLVEKLLAQHGLKPAVLIGLDRTSPEVKEQAKALVEANPEVLLALANNVPLTALTREARKLGNATPFWIVSFVDSSLMVKELGGLAQGQVFAQVVPLPTKRNVRLVKDYQRDYRATVPELAALVHQPGGLHLRAHARRRPQARRPAAAHAGAPGARARRPQGRPGRFLDRLQRRKSQRVAFRRPDDC